ncbi:MAG: undecaprenyl-diphosphate phosphatase [Acidimicrobiia bacterium]
MPIFHAIILGLTQGLSEFLPISSSGHLVLVPWLFGWNDLKDASLAKSFDVSLHLGTLIAVIGYFRGLLFTYIRDGMKAVFNRNERATIEGRLAWLFVLSALPAAAVGAVADSWIEDNLGQIPLIAILLIVFGVVLMWADRLLGKRTIDDFNRRDALFAGAVQVLALAPGVSRSGSTITATRWLGFDRDSAARISFLMSVPITGGAVVFKMAKLVKDGIPADLKGAMVAGIITSAISGWIAVWGTIKLVRTRSFAPFVIYRVVAGVVVLVLAATVLN